MLHGFRSKCSAQRRVIRTGKHELSLDPKMPNAKSRTEKRNAETADDARTRERAGQGSAKTPAEIAAAGETREPSEGVLGAQGMALKDRLAELEQRSLLAEQARQLAHRMRTPLNVIELICENLQTELQQDEEQVARLDSVLDAVSRLATSLSETVKSNRFASGPRRPADAAGIAACTVRLHRGSVERCNAGGAWPQIVLEPRAFEAAIMHCLRLVGLSPGQDAPDLSLNCDLADGHLSLTLRAQGGRDIDSARLGADRTLLLQAAERIVRDIGGTVSVTERTATLRLPIAEA